jgi:antitoxin component YwqK of YwqJK toxin-antitoxin module
MRKLIYLVPLFLIGCGDKCSPDITFYKSGEVKNIFQLIDCETLKGHEVIHYNKKGAIIQMDYFSKYNDSTCSKFFFPNGNLKEIYITLEKLKTGEHKKFYKSGSVRSFTPFLNDKKHGNTFEWYENGTVRKQVTYNCDTLIQQ